MAEDNNAEVCRQAMVVAVEHVRSIRSLFALRRVSKDMKAICDDMLKRVKSATGVSEMWPFSLSLYQFVMEGRFRTCPEMIMCWYRFDPDYVARDMEKNMLRNEDRYPIGTLSLCKIAELTRIASSTYSHPAAAAARQSRTPRVPFGRSMLHPSYEPEAAEDGEK